MNINKNYLDLKESYLFSKINKKVKDFCEKNPEKNVIKLGIGDVTLPLCETVVKEMKKAVEELANKETFKGYGPEQGYQFLRKAIKDYYSLKNVNLETDEIFISDGAKSDIANILDIFSKENTVLIPDPVYPVYLDTNIMNGRKIILLDANLENGFLPEPHNSIKADIIYLCSPNNPTGAVYTREKLKKWVDYANKNQAVILFDAAYEAFIEGENLPKSIFEIEGAKTCAIEFGSFSKTAGFTGTRCAFTVVPKDLVSQEICLNKLWLRRQTTKFNGVPYIVQRGAWAALSPKGLDQIKENINYYKENVKILASVLKEKNIEFVGSENSPYIFLKCPNNMSSWDFFDYLLENANIVGTPGAGFGKNGEGFFRLTGFGDREKTLEAATRLKDLSI